MDLPINIDLPEGFLDEEIRCGYTVSEKMKAVWAVELDLYKELERVCNKYKLKLFAFAGTILGAVRHQGFIPWDDDMDFAMSRADFEILCEHAVEEFSNPYYFDSGDTIDIGSRGHGQLKNSLTTCILNDENDEKCRFNQGIFIDIFIYDNLIDDLQERNKYLLKMQKLNARMLRYKFCYLNKDYSTGIKRCIKKSYIALFQIFNKDYNNKSFYKYQANKKRYEGINTKTCVFLQFVKKGNINFLVFDKKLFEDLVNVEYEFVSLNIPSDYDSYLSKAYGDWKKPVKGNTLHGSVFFDPYKSYEYYLNHRNEILFD